MFDTSLVRSRTAPAPRRVGLFTASILIHSAAVIGAVGLSIASVEFPDQAPRQAGILRPVSPPPSLGDGQPPGPKPNVVPPAVQKDVPKQVVAPPVDEPLPLPTEPSQIDLAVATPEPGESGDAGSATTGGAEGGTGSGTGGSPLGDPDGVGDGTPGLSPAGGGPRIPGGEVRPARVLRRQDPRYPQAMIAARIRTATVTVRCVIDRNGRIRNPEVVTSSYAPFNQAVLDAMERWTFAPGTLRGQPVDTWFELTVRFEVR